ncbi:dTMP kinase [Paenibacillus algorifonticola]|uniref:Thymidylate kinase n=1 Tax=Paenibacillus algorifonticola TaxID=684063 RepID=A0A1I2DKB3_9BACL|nr:dTMP kinase [Paenibacillus algorifonticola]SFE80956.1 dTMP kinase [Paenibacillus algorifonticola]
MSGLLIAMCGLDGAGKTTQIGMLTKWFEHNNVQLYNTKQPTDQYRNDPRVRSYLDNGHVHDMRVIAMLSAADRITHMYDLEQRLDAGIHIISDRYIYSSYAYFKVRGMDINDIKNLYGSIRKPDLTVFLDIKPEITIKRIQARDGHLKYEEKDPSIFMNVREAFRTVLPEDALIIDGERDPQDIHSEIVLNVKTIISAKGGYSYGVK